jgi:hypothetical protein
MQWQNQAAENGIERGEGHLSGKVRQSQLQVDHQMKILTVRAKQDGNPERKRSRALLFAARLMKTTLGRP